jgi:hypothetical protein
MRQGCQNAATLSSYDFAVIIYDMPDPAQAAAALGRVVSAQVRFREAREQRRVAMIDAVRAEVSLREIAAAADCSHESVRRIAADDGIVTIDFDGHTYPLTRQTVEMLVYKLAGHAAGAFPRDVELLQAGTRWLHPAGELASSLQAAMADETGGMVELMPTWAFALYQVLRITQMTIPSPLSNLYNALREGQQPMRR